MEPDPETILDRRGTGSLKWDFRERFTGVKDILPMWVADMDLPVPEAVREAVRRRAEHPVYGYTLPSDGYYTAVIDWFRRRHGWKIRRNWIVCTPGIVAALHLAVQAFTRPGDRVAVQSPVYYPFFWSVEKNRRCLVHTPLRLEDRRYTMNLDLLDGRTPPPPRLLIFCSPHNPVGRVWSRRKLENLAEICIRRDIIVVSDEIHADLTMPDQRHHPLATISQRLGPRLITCTAPSKTFNLAGLQVSNVVIANPELRRRFSTAVARSGLGMMNPFGLVAAEAAYRRGSAWLDRLRILIQQNHRLLETYIRESIPGLSVFPLEGTYLAWLDFRNLRRREREIKDILQRRARLWLDAGTLFGPGGKGFQRMNIACARPVLLKALRRLKTSLRSP